jgi:DNA-binding NtrC family response regulator
MSKPASIMVVDDDPGIVDWLCESLTSEGYSAHGATDPSEALERIKAKPFDLVISDIEMPGMRGNDLVKAIHKLRPQQPIILITAFGSIDLAVESVRAGATDFLAKPFRIEVLLLSIGRALRERQMQREITRLRTTASGPNAVVARSEAMQKILDLVKRAARSDLPLLFTGESGVGKGALAHYAYTCSSRRKGRLVTLNCAALPSGLAEAELFGAKRGAFTDAKEDRIGAFEQAHQGTLFLDEVGELPLDVQPKLLQALESSRVRPLGGMTEVNADVRILAATNRTLEEALRMRTFRADLYHRLNVVRIEIPPLRERKDDIDPILDLTLSRLSQRSGHGPLTITHAARQWLTAQAWPGNVRELVNAVERAAALSDGSNLDVDDFLRGPASTPPAVPPLLESAMHNQLSLAQLEQAYIAQVLRTTGGNKGKAAKILGVDRRTLYRKVAELAQEERGSEDDK